MSETVTTAGTEAEPPWYLRDIDEVVMALDTDVADGLDPTEANRRLERYGPNQIAAEPQPSVWRIAFQQLRDPMNLMLVAVAVVSVAIGEIGTGALVAGLVVLNIVLGTNQELKARASVDALSKMHTPQARVRRGGSLVRIPAEDVVRGDILQLEAGDLAAADARLVRSATLETQEAALTGESAPISKDPSTLPGPDVALGDRSNMVYQNTSITRGTATAVVVATGMNTQMGQIASMLSAVETTMSPLQRELGTLTKVLGAIAWGAVAVIIGLGLVRGQSLESVLLLGVAMAISAIPTGLPTFVQAMLAYGSNQLAQAQAVVKSLSDVETLGATSAINSDKTGTLTMNEMMVRRLYFKGHWYRVEGEGYRKSGAIRHLAGEPEPDFTNLAMGLCLDSDATVSDDGTVIGDPTEAALVVLAAKMGVDAEDTRRAYPRIAEVPFDSAYKFMATFHQFEVDPGTMNPGTGETRFIQMVKGGPDVVLARCSQVATADGEPVPISDAMDEVWAANREMSEKGLRVLAFATRELDPDQEPDVVSDPMAYVDDLVFLGMVGIIDPLRPEAKEAVRVAQEAGIEVRMITGDHAITAAAIGDELGLGGGAMSGAEIQSATDAELIEALPHVHVFGRVTPQDKLRLCKLMQQRGDIVAMTGDAVNDAAALKQADIGVAMGSGSEVTKQAGRMILTDDNFGTLVTAVRLGRMTYDKIVSYVRYQMSQLLSLVLLFLTASIFNINSGVAMTPLMVLFLNFFISVFPVIAIMQDKPNPELMSKPPRDPEVTISSKGAALKWVFYGGTLFAVTLAALLLGPGELSTTRASIPMTMAFVVMALATILSGLVMRRDPESGLIPPILGAMKVLVIPIVMIIAAVNLGFLQQALMTQQLSVLQWLTCLGLALVVPGVVEVHKVFLRRELPGAGSSAESVVAPQRARFPG